MKCIMCRKTLEYAFDYPNDHKPTRGDAISDGGTVEISFGYGSQRDCCKALGFICDDCFTGNEHLFVNHYDGFKL